MFPSNGSLKRHPLPSRGPSGAVPPLQRYYGTLRLPAVRLAALRCLRLAIPPFRPLFVPASSGRELRINLELVSRNPGRHHEEMAGSLRFPSDPHVPTPCSTAPVGPMHARPLRRLGVAPACVNNGGSRDRRFRGSIARHWDSLSTLRSGGFPPPRRTRFRLLAKLCRAGFVNPQGCDERFPSSSLFLLSRAFLTLQHHFPGPVRSLPRHIVGPPRVTKTGIRRHPRREDAPYG